jgi:hypothetical protein
MRESSVAFYAAEAGLQEIWGSWGATMDSIVETLTPGDSADLGWQALSGGSRYRGLITRTDGGSGTPTYTLAVEGRVPGILGGRRTLAYALSGGGASGSSGPYTFGECCDAAAKTRGVVDINTSLISGEDSLPPGWDPGRCSEYPPEDVAGIVAENAADVDVRDDATWLGDPPLSVDPSLANDSVFDTYGDLNYDDLRNMATTHLENWDGSQKGLKYGGDPAPPGCRVWPVSNGSSSGCWIGPRYNPDGSCDTGHPLNMGAPDGPCKDHFPIVLVSGDFAIRGDVAGNYAQGIFVMDTSDVDDLGGDITQTGMGSELDMENGDPGATMVGIIIGKGCLEFDEGNFFGAVYTDGFVTPHPSCDSDDPLFLHSGTGIQYSQCAVQRALTESGLGEAANPSSGGGVKLLTSRAMREILR